MNGFIELPSDVQGLIVAAVLAVVAFVIEWIVKAVPWLSFLKAYAQEWGMLLAVVVVNYIENVVPTGYDDLAIKGILFFFALLGAFVKFARARGVESFQKK